MKAVFLIIFLPLVLFSQEQTVSKWQPFEKLIGKWQGTGEGKFGSSTLEREYFYIMDSTFLMAKGKSVYEKQRKNPEGEMHENWDIFSYDKGRSKYVFRQFHAEDIVNTYSADSLKIDKGVLEFKSEFIENFAADWKAMEVYKFIGDDEFVEIFYLAAPGKQYKEYVRNSFERIE